MGKFNEVMKNVFIVAILLCGFYSYGKSKHKEIITIQADSKKEILIPAYKGDTIRIHIDLYKGKKAKLNNIYFLKYPNTILTKAEKIKDFDYGFITQDNGVYKLVIANNNKKEVDYNLLYTISSTRKKKPAIGYRIQKDTTYGYETSYLKTVAIPETKQIQTEKFYLNSTSNALLKGGKNRIVFPVNLPQGTKEWYYVFTASREEQDIKSTLSTFNLASQLTKYIDENASLQQSIASMSPPPGANICDIYTIKDETNAKLFKEKEDFRYELDGSRENYKSGVVTVNGQQKSYIGIRNPDNLYGIHVGIEIIAVVAKTERKTATINIPIITSSQVPYLIE